MSYEQDPSYRQPSRGFGDTVAKAIQAVTFGKVKPCEPCKKRQEWLNRVFPYQQRPR